MTQYAAVSTKITGQTVTATDWNTYLRDNMDAVGKPKLAWVVKNATQSIPNNTATLVTWQTTNVAVDFALSTSTLVPTYSAYYNIAAAIEWTASVATGFRWLFLRINGVIVAEDKQYSSGGSVESTNRVSCFRFLTAGDVVDVVAQQGSGGALNITAFFPEFQIGLFSW